MCILHFYSYCLLLKDVFHICRLLTEWKYGQHDSTTKVKPKHQQFPPGGVCSIGHKLPLNNIKKNRVKTKILEYPLNNSCPKVVTVISCSFLWHRSMSECFLISLFLLIFFCCCKKGVKHHDWQLNGCIGRDVILLYRSVTTVQTVS